VAGLVRCWGPGGIVGMVWVGLVDRRDLQDEAAEWGGFGGRVGFEDGSAAQAWWWGWPAGCLAGLAGEIRLVVGCRVDHYPVAECQAGWDWV
jgi:hypothetical protein